MNKTLLNEIYIHFFSTLIALLVLSIAYFTINFIASRRVESRRQKRRFQIRSFYVMCIIFLFIMARIWVEGFTHLLAVMGLVSAALVITNKETIMNLVGWLIIMWRGLFSEDDLIQLQEYKGYVKSIGFLYFVLAQVSENSNNVATGKIIKIPNGLVANHALINYSQTSHLLEQHVSIVVTRGSDIEQSRDLFKSVVEFALAEHYKGKKEFTMDYINKHNRMLADSINLKPIVTIKPKFNHPVGLGVSARYYCFANDHESIEQIIWLTLFERLKDNTTVSLSYEH